MVNVVTNPAPPSVLVRFTMDQPILHAKKALEQVGEDLRCRWDAVGKSAERLWGDVCGNMRTTGQQLAKGRATGVAFAVSRSPGFGQY